RGDRDNRRDAGVALGGHAITRPPVAGSRTSALVSFRAAAAEVIEQRDHRGHGDDPAKQDVITGHDGSPRVRATAKVSKAAHTATPNTATRTEKPRSLS